MQRRVWPSRSNQPVLGDFPPTVPGVGMPLKDAHMTHTDGGGKVAETALARVIALRPYQKDRLPPTVEPQTPEPARLYHLICLTFILHVPVTIGNFCGQ